MQTKHQDSSGLSFALYSAITYDHTLLQGKNRLLTSDSESSFYGINGSVRGHSLHTIGIHLMPIVHFTLRSPPPITSKDDTVIMFKNGEQIMKITPSVASYFLVFGMGKTFFPYTFGEVDGVKNKSVNKFKFHNEKRVLFYTGFTTGLIYALLEIDFTSKEEYLVEGNPDLRMKRNDIIVECKAGVRF